MSNIWPVFLTHGKFIVDFSYFKSSNFNSQTKPTQLLIRCNRYRQLKFADETSKKWAIRTLTWMINAEDVREEENSIYNWRVSLVEKEKGNLQSQSLFEDLEDDSSDYDVGQTELDKYMSFRLPEKKPNGECEIENYLNRSNTLTLSSRDVIFV
jgi:hypothetical protein